MKLTFQTAEVVEIIDEAPNVKRYVFRIPEIPCCDFIPGQFTMLDLPIESSQTTRAYSIASPPSKTNNTFELVIVLNPEGKGTPYIFENFKIGTRVPASLFIGKFGKPRPPAFEKDLCFICTGTGIAPFRSMLLDIKNYNIPHKNITLIFGCRYVHDILYRKEMEELQNELSDFSFIPVCSRETSLSWQGTVGYVHQVYKELFSHKQPTQFYICGWKAMIMETVENLKVLGYEKGDIKFELYD